MNVHWRSEYETVLLSDLKIQILVEKWIQVFIHRLVNFKQN